MKVFIFSHKTFSMNKSVNLARKASNLFAATFIVIILLFSCNTTNRMQRQDDRRVSRTQKEIQKARDEREKEYRKIVENQQKRQSKETRKQMKELEKKSKRWREGKKDPFYERWIYNWNESRERRKQQRKD